MKLTLIDFCVEMPGRKLITGLSMPTARLIARWHRQLEEGRIAQVRLRMREYSGQQWLVPLESKHPLWGMKQHNEERES